MTDTVSNTAPALSRLQRTVFIATICAGSFLLFLVQPMIARMALPRLGGAPTVWNSAMLVYQALLLGGYGYAHWLGRFAPRRQGHIHLALFVFAAIMLPIGLSSATPPADVSPVVWVPWLLMSSIGPLFFVVSAQAPLMQRWFANSGGGNPYRLYAASNLGSFAGLIAYPLLVEPFLPLAKQSWLWTGGYIALFALVAACSFILPRTVSAQTNPQDADHGGKGGSFAYWTLLAAIPSGLMLSTTLYLTTDIVAMPLLWVMPLGLYLLSFSLGFSDNRKTATYIALLTPLVLIGGASAITGGDSKYQLGYAALALGLLFLVSASLHGQLYRHRPEPAQLTRFYLAMSVGGVVGGLFCALLAPLIFNWSYEHPILLLAAALVIPQHSSIGWIDEFWEEHGPRLRRWLPLVAIFIALLAVGWLFELRIPEGKRALPVAFIVLICVFCRGQRWPFTISLAALMLSMGGAEKLERSFSPGVMTRSYFGIYMVWQSQGDIWRLSHGTTIHGIQNRAPGHERDPLSYYAPRSGVGLAMRAAPALFGNQARIGVVGLGAGTLACYSQPGQTWRFYEIDPAMEAIARDAKRFTYLSSCQPKADIAIGDARLVLASEPAGKANILAIDAFSSDAVPMHLLTREAFATYGRYLKPDGLLMVHVSNRFLALEPVVAGNLADGWHAKTRFYQADEEELAQRYSHSNWIALSRNQQTLDRLVASAPEEQWGTLEPKPGFTAWTDDFASILPILKPFWRD